MKLIFFIDNRHCEVYIMNGLDHRYRLESGVYKRNGYREMEFGDELLLYNLVVYDL